MRSCPAADFDAWARLVDLGEARALTAGELHNRGVSIAHRSAAGVVFFHVLKLGRPAPGEFPGVALTPEDGPDAEHRWALLEDDVAPFFFCAWIYRSIVDGADLRAACVAASGGALPPFTPATGLHSSAPADPEAAAAVLAEAESRARIDGATAVRILVPMAEVTAGDVVIEDNVQPMD